MRWSSSRMTSGRSGAATTEATEITGRSFGFIDHGWFGGRIVVAVWRGCGVR
jgi:hypothetical protein